MSKSPVKKENKEVKISELKSTYALNPIDQYFGKRTVFLTIGATLESGSDVRVYASTANLSFQAFGSELS
jgi:hypothetical protein